MAKKRALMFLIVGLALAAVALIVLKGRKGGGGAPPPPKESIFVARRDMPFGTPLTIYDPETDKGNVHPFPWSGPVPEGAIKSAATIVDKELVAYSSFVRHEPILIKKTRPKASLYDKSKWYLAKVPVDKADIVGGRWRPSDYVDLVTIGRDAKPKLFATCLQIFAVGERPWLQPPGEEKDKKDKKQDLPAQIFVLVKREDQLSMLPVSTGHQPVTVISSTRTDCEQKGPEICKPEEKKAPPPTQVVEKPPEKEPTPKITAGELLTAAETAIQNAEAAAYPRSVQLLKQAEAELRRIVDEFPRSEEQTKALQLLREVDEKTKLIEKREQWVELEKEIRAAIESGALPQAEAKLKKAEDMEEVKLADDERVADLIAQYRKQIDARAKDVRLLSQMFSTLLKDGNVNRAKEKYLEMKKLYPQHPSTLEAARQLKKKNVLD